MTTFRRFLQLSSIFCYLIAFVSSWRPCSEISQSLRVPCRCEIESSDLTPQKKSIRMNCDRVVFPSDLTQIPIGAPITTFSQKFSGQHAVPTQVFSTSNLPIRNLDFSHNAIRRLSEKSFSGIQESLRELKLADNLLGDSLNPIFSTIEFQDLNNLQTLDLSGNKIKAIEEGILKGCHQLQEFYIDRNSLSAIPSNSLNGPVSLKLLSLQSNHIPIVQSEAFTAQSELEKIDLRNNRISHLEGGAFAQLNNIKEIYLAGNRLSRMNSDVFEGVKTLNKLDLSENFINAFPTIALKEIENIKVLNLSSNMITKLDAPHLQNLENLQVLDLSRNGITSVPPGTFREQKELKFLDLSLNSLRTIEDDALEGLDSLQTLIIRDNNILLIPGGALGRIPHLSNLYLDYNRIAALSSDILGSLQPEDIRYLSLSRNVIRELPSGSFQMFKKLIYLDLSGNSLAVISSEMFIGLESSLIELKLSQNKITNIGSSPLTLTQLRRLDLSHNNIVDVPKNAFNGVDNLVYLNISDNYHLAPLPSNLIHSLSKLQIFDASNCGIKTLTPELFANSLNLRVIRLSSNKIQELTEGVFTNLKNLTTVDLSFNNIMSIRQGSFVNVMNIKQLFLQGNKLSAFKGEFFNTGTGLEDLDISYNQLSYLFPTSFRIHPRLKTLIASNNKFSFFPATLIASLQFLERIDLSNNQLKSVDELDFARLPRLRELLLNMNSLESLNEMAFHNSTQLQFLDLSHNKLERLGERSFEGLTRLQMLNLDNNLLSELPETIFERSRLQMLENIILSNNHFESAPLKSLQRQYFFVSHVDLSHNKIKEVPADDSIMVNIKKLDLSYNPLEEESIKNILSEPKTVRDLNLAGTGISKITTLESPFLQKLNLSDNSIQQIEDNAFERATLLENLDLANNEISDLKSLSTIWPKLGSLQYLDLSNNSIETITQGDLDNLEMLKSLSIHSLEKCTRIEKNAFKSLPNLSKLYAYDFPRLGYLDVQGILSELPGLESLDIELKDAAVGSDQLQPANHPRLKELGIRGYRLRSISSSSLAGLKSKDLNIKLRNTSLASLPPAILFPVPRSANLKLDISGSMITVLTPQLLIALEDRRNSLVLSGLNSNPIHCDCNARALRRWLPTTQMTDIKCVTPDWLHGRLLTEVGDDELTCNAKKPTLPTVAAQQTPTFTSPILKTSSRIVTRTTTAEPDIIWSVPQTTVSSKIRTKLPQVKQPMTNDDTLIIGIVGGVVAFIAILIIIICIVRLRMSSPIYHNAHVMGIPRMPMGPGSVQLSYKGGPPALYALPPYAQSYATLPHKMSSSSQSQPSVRPTYSTMGRMPPFAAQQHHPQQAQHSPNGSNGQTPYYIYQDDKAYR